MKRSLASVYLVLLLVFLMPVFGPNPPSARASEPVRQTPDPALTSPSPPSASAGSSSPRTLRVLLGEEVREMELEEYLRGVLAAEMPASFPEDALKAQAVAARTYALYCAATGKHGDADVCTDSGCCQAWASEESLRERWGGDYERWSSRIGEAVDATAGEVLTFEGQAVFAAFHSSSAGATEDSGALWSPLPYLRSVSSPESAETVPNYVSVLELSPLDFRDVILSAFPQADLTGEAETWVQALEPDESGRVRMVRIGGREISGARMRSLFSLRSAAFRLEYRAGSFVFTVTGSGHGVGMSQYGACVMAGDGADYRQILAHYYPGTSLVREAP